MVRKAPTRNGDGAGSGGWGVRVTCAESVLAYPFGEAPDRRGAAVGPRGQCRTRRAGAAALLIVWAARRISRRRADAVRTFGYRRARTVGALINLTALAVVGAFLASESVQRLLVPQEVDGWTMILLAGTALVVDVGTVLLLFGMRRGGMNARAAFVHNLTDALASVAVLLGGVAVLLAGWTWIDPLVSLLIVVYVLVQVAAMLPSTVRVLMESAPRDLDLGALAAAIEDVGGVVAAHHLHVWLLDERRCALEAHVVVGAHDTRRVEAIKHRVRETIQADFDIDHTTLEMELEETADRADHGRALIPDEGEGANESRGDRRGGDGGRC